MEGRLHYNLSNERYGIIRPEVWKVEGLHCGKSFEVNIKGVWVPTRMEMNVQREWYLYGTSLKGTQLENVRVRNWG